MNTEERFLLRSSVEWRKIACVCRVLSSLTLSTQL